MASHDDRADPAVAPKVLTLAERIDRCYKTMHPKDRKPYNDREVAAGMLGLGVKVSNSYLWSLRRGESVNPSLQILQALAKFFHVPTAYFVGEGEEVEYIDAQIAIVEAMRNPRVRDVALRAGELDAAGLRAVASVLHEIGTGQGIDPTTTAAPRRRSTDRREPPASAED